MTFILTLVLAFFAAALLLIASVFWVMDKVKKKTARQRFLIKRQLKWQFA